MDPIRWAVRIVQTLLRALMPSSGLHRTGNGAACAQADQHADAPAVRPTVPVAGPMPSGEDIGHVRPYLVAHERQQEARQRRVRRRVLIAARGVDIGPWVTHGVWVAV